MSQQTEHFAALIASARAGNAHAAMLVREVCRMAVNKAPEKDLYLIADAIIELHPQFEQELPDAQRN